MIPGKILHKIGAMLICFTLIASTAGCSKDTIYSSNARANIQKGDYNAALRVISRIPSTKLKESLLQELAIAENQQDPIKNALSVVFNIDHLSPAYAATLGDMAMYQASKGDAKNAVRIIAYIDITKERDTRLVHLVHRFQLSNNFASACYVASRISDDELRNSVLGSIAFESARQGQLTAAVTTIAYITDTGVQERLLLETLLLAFVFKDYDSALLVVSSISGDLARSLASMHFANQVLDEKPELAIEVVAYMADGIEKTSAIKRISEHYVEANNEQKALEVLSLISNDHTRDYVALALVNFSIKETKYLAAIQLAQSIQEIATKTQALLLSASAAAGHGEFAESIAALSSLDDSPDKDMLSSVLARMAFDELGSSAVALNLASMVDDYQIRNQVLYDLGLAAMNYKDPRTIISTAGSQTIIVAADNKKQSSLYVDEIHTPETDTNLGEARLDEAYNIALVLTDVALRDALLEEITKEGFATSSYANYFTVLTSISDTDKKDLLLSALVRLYTSSKDKATATKIAYMIMDSATRDSALGYIKDH